MKPIFIKLLNITLLMMVILSMSNMSLESNLSISQNSKRNHILAIYDDGTNSTVKSLYHDREVINNTQLSITYVSIENNTAINNLISNQQLSNSFDEFWIVSEKLNDQPNITVFVNKILALNEPTLIWTNELGYLGSSILSQLGVSSCPTTESLSFNNISYDLEYSNSTDLSSLVNTNLPTLAPIQGNNIEIAQCQLSATAYKIIQAKDKSFLPLLFESSFKSNFTVVPFYLDSSNDVSSALTDSASNFISGRINNYAMNVVGKTLATSVVSFTSFLSSYTYYLSSGWSSAVTFPNTTTLTGTTPATGTSSSGNPNPIGILQSGITLPNIDPKLASDISIAAVGLGLISLIILLIRRYWLVLVAALVGIFAVFKVPTRKISVMDVYHNETRQNIIDILNYRRGQGETVRNISRELEIPLPTLLWHLQILEEFELIAKIKVKREIVVIAMDYVEDFDMELKEFEMTFKSDKAKTFYDYLLNLQQGEVFTAKSVISHTGWSSRTVIRYISKLLELDIIQQNGSAKGYRITTKYYFKLKDLN